MDLLNIEKVTDEASISTARSRIDRLCAAGGLNNNEEDRSLHEDVCERLEALLLFRVVVPDLHTMTPDDHQRLGLVAMNEVYWREIDNISDWVRARTMEIVAERVAALADSVADQTVTGMHLRQLVELTFWAIYYQRAQTTAWNVINRLLPTLPQGVFLCEALEQFVRGAVAPSPERCQELLRAVVDHPPSVDTVQNWTSELDPTVAKQRAVVRWLAEKHDSRDQTQLVMEVARLESAYRYLCGYVHVTPLLLGAKGGLGFDHQQLLGRLTLRLVNGVVYLLTRLYLDKRIGAARFLPIFTPRLSEDGPVNNIQIPWLNDLGDGNKAVIFDMEDGLKAVVYGKAPASKIQTKA